MLVVKETIKSLVLECSMVLYGETLQDLQRRVQLYFPSWTWLSYAGSFGGGYWRDRASGEQYVIREATSYENSLINAAYDWHGGSGSALYQFASTGCIFGEDHRKRLLAELGACAPRVKDFEERVFNELVKAVTTRMVLATSPTGR